MDDDIYKDWYAFSIFIRNLVDIDGEIYMIIENYKFITETQFEDQKRAITILSKSKHDLLDYNLGPDIVFVLHENFERNRIDSMLNKHLKAEVHQVKLQIKWK